MVRFGDSGLRWACGLVLMVGVCQLVLANNARAEYDRSKFCKADADSVIILVDVTTAFDDRAKDLFQRGITGIVSALTPGERVRIATIEDSYSSSQLLYEGCVPYCSNGLLDFFLSECTDGLIRLETRRQLSEIKKALQERLSKATSDMDTSDIVRTIAYAVQPRGSDRHLDLFVFSDLIENSEFMSGKIFWSQPTSTSMKQIEDNSLMPDLREATVNAFGVGRGGSMGRHPLTQDRINKLHEFWTAYFAAAGAPDAQISEALYLE